MHPAGRLPHRNGAGRGDDQRHHSSAAGLLHLGAGRRAVGRLPHSKRAGHADAGRHRGRRVRQLAEHQRRGQRGPAELRHRNHRQHTHHQQHGQRRELTTVGDVSTGTLTASGAATAASFAATGALTGATLTITGAASTGPLDCESLDCTFTATSGGVSTGSGLRRRDELGHGLRAAALRLQHAHRDQHLRLLGRSLPDEELGGLEQAASVQQQRGLQQRPGAAAAGQPERRSSWSGTAGRTSASSS